ncbi:LOW QUALITY PROTEIN: putative inactive peptidyl-prolyl cis-trans isomerase-like 6 [Chlamydotis macqueenii]
METAGGSDSGGAALGPGFPCSQAHGRGVNNPWRLYVVPLKKQELRGQVWAYASSAMGFVGGQLLGDEKELLRWSYCEWDYRNFKPEALYQAIAGDFYTRYLKNSQASIVFVYLEIAIEEQPIRRLLFELFLDTCPRTCENFHALCAGGAKSPRDSQLTCKNSLFRHLLKNAWIQGGHAFPGVLNIITGRGDGGESIYGPTFEDKSFSVHHKERGVFGMANKGRHSNSSQFYISLQPAPYLDKKYVAFGQMNKGMEVLQRLEAIPTYNERPTGDSKIINCGTFEPCSPAGFPACYNKAKPALLCPGYTDTISVYRLFHLYSQRCEEGWAERPLLLGSPCEPLNPTEQHQVTTRNSLPPLGEPKPRSGVHKHPEDAQAQREATESPKSREIHGQSADGESRLLAVYIDSICLREKQSRDRVKNGHGGTLCDGIPKQLSPGVVHSRAGGDVSEDEGYRFLPCFLCSTTAHEEIMDSWCAVPLCEGTSSDWSIAGQQCTTVARC